MSGVSHPFGGHWAGEVIKFCVKALKLWSPSGAVGKVVTVVEHVPGWAGLWLRNN